ncbi:hypothetical protein [Xanthomonas phage X1]|nr:hypothetical protein [Xanthomonas phage X1]
MRLILDWTNGEYDDTRTWVEPVEFESKEVFFEKLEAKKIEYKENRDKQISVREKYVRKEISYDEYFEQLDKLDSVNIVDDKGREFFLGDMIYMGHWDPITVYTVDEWYGD